MPKVLQPVLKNASLSWSPCMTRSCCVGIVSNRCLCSRQIGALCREQEKVGSTECVRVERVHQGVLTLFCRGVPQTCHDDRVVELKEQLVVEEVDGEGQERKKKKREVESKRTRHEYDRG